MFPVCLLNYYVLFPRRRCREKNQVKINKILEKLNIYLTSLIESCLFSIYHSVDNYACILKKAQKFLKK